MYVVSKELTKLRRISKELKGANELQGECPPQSGIDEVPQLRKGYHARLVESPRIYLSRAKV